MEKKSLPPLTEQALEKHVGGSDESSKSQFDEEGSVHGKDQSSNSSRFGHEEGDKDESNSSSGDLARSENRAVNKSKACVYIILLVGALATAIAAWFLVRKEEQNKFESDFNVYAGQLLEIEDDNSAAIFRQLQTLSTAITARALDQNQSFPYSTVPNYDLRSKEVGLLSGSKLLLYAPLVYYDKATEWEQWSELNQNEIMFDTFGASGQWLADPGPEIYPIPEYTYQDIDVVLLNKSIGFVEARVPVLQFGPDVTSSGLLKMDLNSHPFMQRAIRDSLKVTHTYVSEVFDMKFLLGSSNSSAEDTAAPNRPKSIIAEPVFFDFSTTSNVTGFIMAVEPWDEFFGFKLPMEADTFAVNLRSTCGEDWTYNVRNGSLVYMGIGDLHDTRYNHLRVSSEFAPFTRFDASDDGFRHCNFSINVYPSRSFEDEYYTNEPYLFSMMLLLVFLATVAVFVTYDFLVTREQRKVEEAAKRTTDIVKSLFPKQVGDRLLAEAEQNDTGNNKNSKQKRMDAFSIGNAVQEAEAAFAEGGAFRSDPIAEFYTDTTIMFADIVGFTAWSSMREPKQVFKLLETIYRDYDQKANRRGVFKVETIGDCYVAVCGLPQPRKDHYAVMARFARECVYGFGIVTRQLEETLGPDTSDLAIRVGLHSGPVTAGVLRGDRARFQLFGDTMNTASRMESKGKANKIHISQETADLLSANGKSHWFSKREDLIVAKGKGQLQTYWLNMSDEKAKSATSGDQSDSAGPTPVDTSTQILLTRRPEVVQREIESRDERLVKWNTDILGKLLGSILGKRKATSVVPEAEGRIFLLERDMSSRKGGALPELKDVIEFPPVSAKDSGTVDVPDKVKQQLNAFVTALATMHRENPFHSFEHGSHAMMALMKLFSRVSKASENESVDDGSFALLNDPVTQFAAALSTLMLGVDNRGVPNTQLTKERANIAILYGNTCVSEQNALDLSWNLLMGPDYGHLRRALYTTSTEFKRFRQLVVNCVLTNSKELLARRKILWQSNFGEVEPKNDEGDLLNRKATILLESLVQAADAAHTMQHWQIFVKWNTRLFEEAVRAYKDGRADYDPAEFWHDTEIGSFDNIVLPLAKNLKEAEVLGASGDEYLGFAMRNRREWVTRGKQVLEEMKQALNLEPPEKEEEKPEQAPTPAPVPAAQGQE